MVILVALRLGAAAAEAPAAEASGSPARALAEAGIVLAGPEPWPPLLVAELAAGLEALPEPLRRFPGGPLELALHPEPSPLGMGDGSDERPEWSDGLERFHLYAWAEADDPRAASRLANVSSAHRVALWRRRAIVHAVVRRWDEHRRWSERDEWKQLVGWLDAFDRPLTFTHRPLITYPWAFSRQRGMASARLDLATFAEEALVPVTSLAPGALAADDRVRCQEFSKSRVLSSFLAEAGARRPALLAPNGCHAFDEWAQVETFSHLEVLFAAPSGVRPQSLFGHVSLRVVRKPTGLVKGPGTATVVELAALTGPAETGGKYIAKGLTGGFKAVFSTTSLAGLLKQNLEIEQRTIRRYRLELTRAESLRALQRIWELERRGYVDYYFFSENCARMLVFLLEPVLESGGEIESPGQFVVLPASALDTLSAVTVTRTASDGTRPSQPLLTAVGPDFLSSRDQALEAERRRATALVAITQTATEEHGDAWRRIHGRLRNSDSAAREATYREQLGPLLHRTIEDDPSLLRLAHEYVTASLRIERYALDRLETRHSNIELTRLKLPEELQVPTTEALLEERQRSFQTEDAHARLKDEIAKARRLNELLRDTPRRPPTEDEKEVFQKLTQQRSLFNATLELEGRMVDLEGVAPAGPSALRPEITPPEPTASDKRWQERSGTSRLSLEAGVAGADTSNVSLALTLRTALFAEELGERRERGIGTTSELRLLDVRSTWAFGLDWPRHLRSDFTVVGFRTIQRPPVTLRDSLMDWVGWGWDLEVRQRSGRAQPLRAVVAAELIAPVFTSTSGQSQTLISLGAAPEVRAVWLPKAFALGARVKVSHRGHFGGAHANALRLDLSWQPRWTVLGGPVELWHSWQAELTASRLFFGQVVLGARALVSIDREGEVYLPFASAGLVAEW